MSDLNRSAFVLAAAFALGGAACATESAAFVRMSAEDHERAASAPAAAAEPAATPSEHVEAARRLRAWQESACTDVADGDREQGPLAHRGRIARIEPLSERPYPKEMLQPAGVALYVRAAPGVTREWMGRVLECHMAYHAVVGDRVPDRDSPLFVADARVALSSTGDGFRIAITARDVTSARAIIERAQALVE